MHKCWFSDEGGAEFVREIAPTERYLLQYFADRDRIFSAKSFWKLLPCILHARSSNTTNVISPYVCPQADLNNDPLKFHTDFCTVCLRSWLGSPLARLWHVIYFRFLCMTLCLHLTARHRACAQSKLKQPWSQHRGQSLMSTMSTSTHPVQAVRTGLPVRSGVRTELAAERHLPGRECGITCSNVHSKLTFIFSVFINIVFNYF